MHHHFWNLRPQITEVKKWFLKQVWDNLYFLAYSQMKKQICPHLLSMTSTLCETSNDRGLYSSKLILLEKSSNCWDLRGIIYRQYNFLCLPLWCSNEVIIVWPFSLWQIEFSMTWWCDKVIAQRQIYFVTDKLKQINLYFK